MMNLTLLKDDRIFLIRVSCKSIGMIFFVWLGIQKLGMDYQIFVPMICFFWFFTHLVEAFVIQHYIQKNVPQQLQNLQIK